MLNFNELSKNNEVVELLKRLEEIERKIFNLDNEALINYELAKLEEQDFSFMDNFVAPKTNFRLND